MLGSDGKGPWAGIWLTGTIYLPRVDPVIAARCKTLRTFPIAFGALFFLIGGVYFYVSNDIAGAFMLITLGVAMATMTMIVIHAMETDN